MDISGLSCKLAVPAHQDSMDVSWKCLMWNIVKGNNVLLFGCGPLCTPMYAWFWIMMLRLYSFTQFEFFRYFIRIIANIVPNYLPCSFHCTNKWEGNVVWKLNSLCVTCASDGFLSTCCLHLICCWKLTGAWFEGMCTLATCIHMLFQACQGWLPWQPCFAD